MIQTVAEERHQRCVHASEASIDYGWVCFNLCVCIDKHSYALDLAPQHGHQSKVVGIPAICSNDSCYCDEGSITNISHHQRTGALLASMAEVQSPIHEQGQQSNRL
jgi:hypothetical protein